MEVRVHCVFVRKEVGDNRVRVREGKRERIHIVDDSIGARRKVCTSRA